MKKEKKVDYLIRTGIISEEIDKIEINLRGELKIFLMNYYLKLLFDNEVLIFCVIFLFLCLFLLGSEFL